MGEKKEVVRIKCKSGIFSFCLLNQSIIMIARACHRLTPAYSHWSYRQKLKATETGGCFGLTSRLQSEQIGFLSQHSEQWCQCATNLNVYMVM